MFDISGTNNSDRLIGTGASENIYTGDGIDTVLAGAGNDSVNGAMVDDRVSYFPVNGAKLMSGEDGNDFLFGGSDADTIAGDAGNDTLYGGAGSDSLSGGLGDDQIKGGDGNDAIDAGDGADDIDTDDGVDSVLGGSGNDNINGYTVDAQAGTYSFNAYAGNKSVDAGAGDDFVFGGTGNDTLAGGDGLDSLYGHAGNDSLLGGAGADAIQTGDGQDTVLGGDGNDNINGHLVNAQTGNFTFTSSSGPKSIDAGAGEDFVYGGSDADTMAGEAGNDTLHGAAGNDALSGGLGDDEIKGGEGNDTIDAGDGADDIDTDNGVDSVLAGSGNDNINGHTVDAQAGTYSFSAYEGAKSVDAGAGNDFVFGGTGNDSLVGGDGLDSLHGHTGNDTLQGDASDDALFGDEGDDSLLGGAGSDDIQTGDGQDTVLGGEGNDNINGHNVDAQERAFTFTSYSGPKSIDAGAGDDFVYGGSGNDSIVGGAGHDTLHGSTGADSLDGGFGNDSLTAGDGNDTLASFYGQDTLNGGIGDDRYLIGTKRFTLTDESGADTAVVSVDFVKIPSFIETVEYTQGTQALPYWVSALLPDEAAGLGFLSALGSSRTYSYTFPQVAPAYLEANSDYVRGWTAFTSAEIAATKLSFNYIAGLVDLKFVQSSVADAPNTLSFANNTQTASAGFALNPFDSALGSDVFLNDTTENREAKDGTYAALTLIHEIGHALGLKHPFSAPDSTGDSATPPYLSTSEDVTAWTVMSYTSSEDEYAFEYSELDIAALQYLYGPSPTSRTTNDTYTVSKTAANFVWDGAGADLLDASALTQPVTLYLTPGYWGYVGAAAASTITAPGQVTVNFGSTIENLKGGSQADRLYGNASANQILGGAGDDVLQGWDGSDTLSGGLGNDTLYGGSSDTSVLRDGGTDTAVFSGAFASYQYSFSTTPGALTITSPTEGTDTLWGIERVQFSDVTLSVPLTNGKPVAPKLIPTSGVQSTLDPQVIFTTTQGTFSLELNSDLAPISTANMLAYVNSGFYNGTLFHRVIPSFMAQGGGFTTGLTAASSDYANILNEAGNGLKNLRGTVAMARGTNLDSANSQFFVNYINNDFLDGKYTVFGKVISGMSVVDQMSLIPTQTKSIYSDVPVTDIVTTKAEQTQNGIWTSTTGLLALSDLKTNTSWEYSLNGGSNWLKGAGYYLRVPQGFYDAGSLQVRQTDSLGAVSSPYVFPGSLQVNQADHFQLTGTSVFWKDLATGLNALPGVQMSPELTNKTDALGVVDLSGVDSLSSAATGTTVLSPTLASPSNAKSAITLTDVLAALKIYLGKSVPDAYASPFNYVAADFDASGSVTLTDVLQMLKYYLGKTTANNLKPEWVFVDAADLSGTGSSATALAANGQALSKTNALPHAVDLDLMSGIDTLQLVGVLRGDVDGSWTAPTN